MMPAVTITSSYDLLQHIKSSSATHSLLARGVLVSCTNTPGSHPVLALSCRKVCQCWPRSKIEHIPSRIHSMSAKMCSKVHPKSIRGEFHANHCNCLKRSTCVTRILPSISWQMLLWLSTKRPIKISCQCRNIMKIDEVECIVQTPTHNNRQLAKKMSSHLQAPEPLPFPYQAAFSLSPDGSSGSSRTELQESGWFTLQRCKNSQNHSLATINKHVVF